MASTMGPGIKVDPSKTRDLIEARSVPRPQPPPHV